MAGQRQFDEGQVLDAAMLLFWQSGYSGASVQDIVDRTGLQRGSLYNAFGDKRGLFLAALDRYTNGVHARLEALDAPGPALPAIRDVFEDIVTFAVGEGRGLGCLMTNSAIERAAGDSEIAARLRDGMTRVEDAFCRALLRARDQGEIAPATDCRKLARHLVICLNGLRIASILFPERERLMDFVDTVISGLTRR